MRVMPPLAPTVHPCRLWGPMLQSGGTKSEVAHKWAQWLHNPCCLGRNEKWPTSGLKVLKVLFFFEVLKPSKKSFF